MAKTITAKIAVVKRPAKKPPLKKKPAKKKPPSKKGKSPQKIEGTTFKTIQEVTDYLNDEGYTIAKSKVGADIKSKYIPKHKGGLMKKSDVDLYASKFITKDDGDPHAAKTATEKLSYEVRRSKVKAEREEFNFEIEKGKYVLRSGLIQELASRASVLKETLGPNFIKSNVEAIIRACNGDIKKAPEVIAIYEQRVEEAFDNYSKPMSLEAPTLLIREDS